MLAAGQDAAQQSWLLELGVYYPRSCGPCEMGPTHGTVALARSVALTAFGAGDQVRNTNLVAALGVGWGIWHGDFPPLERKAGLEVG